MDTMVGTLAERILLADDHQIVRRGLKSLIQGLGPNWEICGEAENGKEAVEKTMSLHPDLVILDISMPVQNGLEAAREIRRKSPDTKILILSMHDSPHMKDEARKAGADAYVVKSAASDELRSSMERVLNHTS